jgi:hypothetical protein
MCCARQCRLILSAAPADSARHQARWPCRNVFLSQFLTAVKRVCCTLAPRALRRCW